MPREDEDRTDVGGKAEYAHEQQQPHVVHFVGGSAEQPHAGFDERVDADDQEHERADRGGEHFESRPSPGAFVARFALHEHRGDGGGDQHRHVGEHVAGVDQQRQRSGDDGADHFGDEHRGSQPQ